MILDMDDIIKCQDIKLIIWEYKQYQRIIRKVITLNRNEILAIYRAIFSSMMFQVYGTCPFIMYETFYFILSAQC